MKPCAWLALALAGCSLSPERFAHEVAWEWCDWRHGCGEIDAAQAEMCLEAEEAAWNGWLADEGCEYAQDRSRRLFRVFEDDLAACHCDSLDGYSLLSALRRDICAQAHSPVDTQHGDETGDTAR